MDSIVGTSFSLRFAQVDSVFIHGPVVERMVSTSNSLYKWILPEVPYKSMCFNQVGKIILVRFSFIF